MDESGVCHDDDAPVCVGRWYLYMGVGIIVVSFMFLAVATSCCCCPLGVLCGRMWAHPGALSPLLRPWASPAAGATIAPAAAGAPVPATNLVLPPVPPATARDQRHAQLAAFLATGGQPALDLVAQELGATREAVQAWWVHWQCAQRGPRRG